MTKQMPKKNKKDVRAMANGLINDANRLLGEVIRDTKPSDERANAQKTHWTKRHRLQVLLAAAEETRKSAPNVVIAPWFLTELAATLNTVRKWRQKPIWSDIETCLKDKEAFNHTIAMLHVAEHLNMSGHNAQVVKEGLKPSPDLILKAQGGTRESVVIECYQPIALCGEVSKLDSTKAENIIETSMRKARRQIGRDIIGIIVICGYNQSTHNLRLLRQAAENRLSKTDRINLCGFWLIMLGVKLDQRGDKLSFQAIRSAEFIRNPSYFGTVQIDDSVPINNPNLIKNRLIDVSTDVLESGNIRKEPTNGKGNESKNDKGA
jgi:hypothetical protein